MVFGAEGDERFDWTRFDVDPVACTFTTSNSTMTLDADCTTDTTIMVPNGFTLDGNGHKITAVDGSSGAFAGAVVENERRHDARQEPQDRRREHRGAETARASSTASPSCPRAARSRTSR